MHFYLYEIKNKIDGKIYVGVHKTTDINDGYMGSGTVIKRAIDKHGVENFEKSILETFDNADSMFAREKEVVTEEFLARDDVYNLRRGGYGGFDHINDGSEEHLARTIRAGRMGNDACRNNKTGVYADGYVNPLTANPDMQAMGKIAALSPESRAKRLATYAERGHAQGDKNSQFGTCWMWHELIGNKKCKKDMLPLFIEQGWIKGRMGR